MYIIGAWGSRAGEGVMPRVSRATIDVVCRHDTISSRLVALRLLVGLVALLHWPNMEIKGISDALQALKYSNAVEVIDEVLARNPDATVADVRQYASARQSAAEKLLDEEQARIERSVCRHCGAEIVKGNDGAWYHGRESSWGSRGCRSYSFDRLGTWDETLGRSWKASPA